MALSDVTDREAVLSALAEYDRLGRDQFLETYGFGEARRYVLVHDEKHYDSKAILGVAHGYQWPDLGPLTSAEFSGGIGAAVDRLKQLGFEVVADGGAGATRGADEWDLRIGDTIMRTDLHSRFGGSTQDGVTRSSKTPNVLLFTDPSSGEQMDILTHGRRMAPFITPDVGSEEIKPSPPETRESSSISRTVPR